MEAQKGLVSIILPFANAGDFLVEAIESALAQTYSNWELLLIDDGSTDGSEAIAQKYADASPGKVRCLTHPDRRNLGVTRSRNRGAQEAHGEYLAFLDADDVWLPEMLETRVAALSAHLDAGLVYGPSEYWYGWNREDGAQSDSVPPVAPGDRLYMPPYLLLNTHPLGRYGAPCPSSFVMRREAFQQIGGFVEDFHPATKQLYEDSAFLSKVYLELPVFVGEQSLERYRCRRTSIWNRTVGTRSEEPERRFYFRWLRDYLHSKSITDPEIWKAVRREGWMYGLPLPARVTYLLRRASNRLTKQPESQQHPAR